VIDLTEGVLKVMFWTKFKLVAAGGLCAAVILTGSAVIGREAMGSPRQQAGAAKLQSKTSVGQGGTPVKSFIVNPERIKLTANEQARLDVAKKIRDVMFKSFSEGEIDLIDYLRWQQRYDDIVGEMARSDADRLRHYESHVALMKQIEERSRELFRLGRTTQTNLLVAELERLDAEIALERFRASVKQGQVPASKAER